MSLAQLKDRLQALYLAEISFREAKAGCDILAGLPPHPREPINCVAAGVVVSYGRSFGQNDGISGIRSEFDQFPEGEYAEAHAFVIKARNRIYAHTDFANVADGLRPGIDPAEVERIKIVVHVSGQTSWEVQYPLIPDNLWPHVAALCDYQAARIKRASDETFLLMVGWVRHEPGVYYLGEDFPRRPTPEEFRAAAAAAARARPAAGAPSGRSTAIPPSP